VERVAFLVERTGERIPCLLNPESIVVRRLAGVRTRRSTGGPLTGAGLQDDPLLYTGGGRTEINLDLLFDISIGGSSIATEDVRDLTRPLWQLSEGVVEESGTGRAPVVRFVWGKAWNILGVVVAVAERLENFTSQGFPGRSWMRMRLLRVPEPLIPSPDAPTLGSAMPELPSEAEISPDQLVIREIRGGMPEGSQEGGPPVRLDVIAHELCGHPWWKPIAELNNVDDPTRLPTGTLLRIPNDWLSRGDR
jgi:hypothetical protein